MKAPLHLRVCAKCVHLLDRASWANTNDLDHAAMELAYTCLRVAILGQHGLDIPAGGARLIREPYHLPKSVLRRRLNREQQALRQALKHYPAKAGAD